MPSRIDATGGSATGTVSGDNEATWCDIFPNVALDVTAKVVDIFKRLAKEMGGEDCLLKVINDGEVTALAAVQKIKKGNVMGISMGSSERGMPMPMVTSWVGSTSCATCVSTSTRTPRPTPGRRVTTLESPLYFGQRPDARGEDRDRIPENYQYPHLDMRTIKHETHAQCLKLVQAD